MVPVWSETVKGICGAIAIAKFGLTARRNSRLLNCRRAGLEFLTRKNFFSAFDLRTLPDHSSLRILAASTQKVDSQPGVNNSVDDK